MKRRCASDDDCGMRIASRASSPGPLCVACSVIRKYAWCAWCAGEKNGLWGVHADPVDVLRSQTRWVRDLSCGDTRSTWSSSDPASHLPPELDGETGATALAGGQSVLHQTVRVLCRPVLPGVEDPGCGAGAASRLAKRSRPWRCSPCASNSVASGRPAPAVIGIDEISIRKGHPTGSWSATWSGGGRSGSGARIARRKA